MSLLIPTPNAVHKCGSNTDRFVINPEVSVTKDNQFLQFLGILLGIAMRTRKPMDLHLARPMWKLLAGLSLSPDDLEEVNGYYRTSFIDYVLVVILMFTYATFFRWTYCLFKCSMEFVMLTKVALIGKISLRWVSSDYNVFWTQCTHQYASQITTNVYWLKKSGTNDKRYQFNPFDAVTTIWWARNRSHIF